MSRSTGAKNQRALGVPLAAMLALAALISRAACVRQRTQAALNYSTISDPG